MPGSPLPAPLSSLADRSASPASVRAALENLRDVSPDLIERLEGSEELARTTVAVVAASRSLTRTIERDPGPALDLLDALEVRPVLDPASPDDLVAWRDAEYLRIAARDLVGIDPLEVVGAALARLGREVLDTACALAASADPDEELPLAVIGMGKLGGSELNYSSDVDVLFVGEGPRTQLERRARAVMDIARRCFRVDPDLRPEGRDGPLVRSLGSYEAYWDRWAEPWEFQALLKARPAGGDREQGELWLEAAQRSLWSHPFGSDDLRYLRAMKARAEAEVVRKGLEDRELKRGPGGIRDIEFTVQLLQLVHGHLDPELRGPTTLSTLAEMAEAGYVDPDDAGRLADAYRLLREVEHRLQLVDEQQVHVLPTDDVALDRLARVMGRRDDREGTAAEQLRRELRRARVTVRGIHERVYFRPLLEAFARTSADDGLGGALDPEAISARLTAFGFVDARRTRAAVGELTRGLNRTSRLMDQLLPLLLDWLSQAPDPDLGLLLVRNMLSGPARTGLADTFRDSPAAAQALCRVSGTSRLLGDILVHNPDLVARLPHPDRLTTRDRAGLVASAEAALRLRDDTAERQASLRRWQRRNLLGIGARDVLDHADVRQVGSDLTSLAEATLEAALSSLEPSVPFAVIGLGRAGGAELAYASDLDVVFVHDGAGAAGAEEAKRLATGLTRLVGGSTPAQRIYDIDADLRPEGRSGPLARSLGAYEVYWREHAQTWERQAMTRARVVAGDPALGDALLDVVEPFVWEGGLDPDEIRQIRRMKARIESERIPSGEDPDFHLKLGRGSLSDVEFTAQMLQLQYGVRATGTLDALRALCDSDVLQRDDGEVLTEAYRFCERVRNRWYLVNSAPGDALPSQPEPLGWLARSMDTTPGELRDSYRRVTRRARRVVERVFYGLPAR